VRLIDAVTFGVLMLAMTAFGQSAARASAPGPESAAHYSAAEASAEIASSCVAAIAPPPPATPRRHYSEPARITQGAPAPGRERLLLFLAYKTGP